MNPHHHLHQAPSNSNLSSASKTSGTSSTASGKGKRSLFSKLNKLVPRNPAPRARSASSSTSVSTPAADAFKIVHAPDVVPLYSPPRPTVPRTQSECEEALQEMWTPVATAAEDKGPPARSQALPAAQQQRAPPIPPKDGLIPPPSFPPRAAPWLNTNLPPPPPPPKTAGARLESILGSPTTIHSIPTPTGRGGFPLTLSTPRTVDSNRIQRAMARDSSHPPRPLSERPLLPMERLRPGSAPLTSSPVRTTFAERTVQTQPGAHTQLHAPSRPHRHSPLSPLGQCPPMVLLPSRLSSTDIDDTVVPRRPSQPSIPNPPAARRPRPPHQPMSFDSMRVDDSADSSSDNEERTPMAVASRDPRPVESAELDFPVPPTAHQQEPRQAKCLLCPEPCSPSQGLCTACTEHYRPQTSDVKDPDSDSDYESIVVRTPSLSPRKTKPKPLSIQITTQHSTASAESHGPTTATPTARSFSRPITPTRSPQYATAISSPPHSSPRTPETPRGWSRVSMPTHAPDTTAARSQSLLPGTAHNAQQLQVPSSPTPRKVSTGDGGESGSALYHLERSMQRENWEPLTPGARPEYGHDVVRVTSGAARRVVVRDSNDQNADTMKMLVDQEAPEVGRRHDGGGGGGGGDGAYVDWFSYYAEKEAREQAEAERSHERSPSAGSSIYDRIQSIYDDYGGEEEENQGEEAVMF